MNTSADVPDGNSVTPKSPASKSAEVDESADSSNDSSSGSESSSESNQSKENGSKSSENASSSEEEQSGVSSNSAQQFETPKAVLNPVSIDFSQIKDLPVSNDESVGVSAVVQPPTIASGGSLSTQVQPNSPIVTTPGKSLSIQMSTPSTAKQALIVKDLVPTSVHATPNLVPSNQVSFVTPNSVVATNNPQGSFIVQGGIRNRIDQKASRKTEKKIKSSEQKLLSDQRKAERYQRKFTELESVIHKAEKDKLAKVNRASKDKKEDKLPKKAKKKTKKACPVEASSDGLVSDNVSSSSESSAPGPSSRIAKLAFGRRLQQLAMARVKEIRRIRNVDLGATQVLEALKVIDTIELDINPEMAYALFHRVPGSGLPHMEKFYRDFSERYCILVKAIVKFHLLQAQKLNIAKTEALGPESENPFFPWWQFLNDFARAPATTTHLQAPPSDDVGFPPASKKAKSSSALENISASRKSAKKHKGKSASKKAEAAAELVFLAESIISKSRGRKRKKKKQASSSSEVYLYDFWVFFIFLI